MKNHSITETPFKPGDNTIELQINDAYGPVPGRVEVADNAAYGQIKY